MQIIFSKFIRSKTWPSLKLQLTMSILFQSINMALMIWLCIFIPDSWIWHGSQSYKLPKQDSKAPNIWPWSVNVITQALWCHPFDGNLSYKQEKIAILKFLIIIRGRGIGDQSIGTMGTSAPPLTSEQSSLKGSRNNLRVREWFHMWESFFLRNKAKGTETDCLGQQTVLYILAER